MAIITKWNLQYSNTIIWLIDDWLKSSSTGGERVQVDKDSRTRGKGVEDVSVWFQCWSEAGDGHYSPFDAITSWICALCSGQVLHHYLPHPSTGLSTHMAYGTYSTHTIRTPVFDLSCIYDYLSLLYLSVCPYSMCGEHKGNFVIVDHIKLQFVHQMYICIDTWSFHPSHT